MPNWSDLLNEFRKLPNDDEKSTWLSNRLDQQLAEIGDRRDQNVIVYASGFLQKPSVPSFATSISREDINGLMCAAHGLDFAKGLSLIIHTPGGDMASTETMIDYLRSKFGYVEAIVPVYAMSGGTMIALSSNKIVLGRQSQLGPIDAQLPVLGGFVSAASILDQFNTARKEISEDRDAAIVWAPILQTMGPSLLSQAQNALELGQQIAESCLATHMPSRYAAADGIRQAVDRVGVSGRESPARDLCEHVRGRVVAQPWRADRGTREHLLRRRGGTRRHWRSKRSGAGGREPSRTRGSRLPQPPLCGDNAAAFRCGVQSRRSLLRGQRRFRHPAFGGLPRRSGWMHFRGSSVCSWRNTPKEIRSA